MIRGSIIEEDIAIQDKSTEIESRLNLTSVIKTTTKNWPFEKLEPKYENQLPKYPTWKGPRNVFIPLKTISTFRL